MVGLEAGGIVDTETPDTEVSRQQPNPHQTDARLYAKRLCAAGLDPLSDDRVEKDEDDDDSGYGQPQHGKRDFEQEFHEVSLRSEQFGPTQKVVAREPPGEGRPRGRAPEGASGSELR